MALKGTCGILLPDPPGQRFWLNIKIQDHSKTKNNKKQKNQDHSKAYESPKSSNDTDVVWPRGKGPTLQQKSQKQRTTPEAGIWAGPGQAAEESQGPCRCYTHHPQHHRATHGLQRHCHPVPPRLESSRVFRLQVLDIWLEAWQSRSPSGQRRLRPKARGKMLMLS